VEALDHGDDGSDILLNLGLRKLRKGEQQNCATLTWRTDLLRNEGMGSFLNHFVRA
jgi:hypothetical protein